MRRDCLHPSHKAANPHEVPLGGPPRLRTGAWQQGNSMFHAAVDLGECDAK